MSHEEIEKEYAWALEMPFIQKLVKSGEWKKFSPIQKRWAISDSLTMMMNDKNNPESSNIRNRLKELTEEED
jgi:hypothetical protein